MWLNQLKIAIIEENIERLDELMDTLPKLEEKDEINQALHLIKEATSLVQNQKEKTAVSLNQMKKNIDFLNATQAPRQNNLDIQS